MSEFVHIVASKPMLTWQGKNVVALDWDDGPTHGICEFIDPPISFIFTQIGYTIQKGRITNRLYSVLQTSLGTVDRVNSLIELSGVGSPELQKELNSIYNEGVETHLLFQSNEEDLFFAWWFRTYM